MDETEKRHLQVDTGMRTVCIIAVTCNVEIPITTLCGSSTPNVVMLSDAVSGATEPCCIAGCFLGFSPQNAIYI